MKLKIALLSAAVLSLILCVLGSFIYFTVDNRIIQLESDNLLNQAQSVAQYYSNYAAVPHTNDRELRMWLHRNLHDNQILLLYNATGSLQMSVGEGNTSGLMESFHPVDTPVQKTLSDKDLFPVIDTIYPVSSPDGNHTVGYVVLSARISNIPEYMESLFTVLMVGSVGAVVLAAIGGYMIASISLRPIHHLIRVVEGIQANRLYERVNPVRGKDEVARLTITFNQMLQRIERSFEQQSRFVADASHEFRTPLTTILGYANLLHRWGKTKPEILEKSIQVIRKESSRLQHLADDLLLLAGLEAERSTPVEDARLDEIVLEVADELFPLHTELETSTHLNASTYVQMTPHHLKQIVTNLITNALKYTPAGGRIDLSTGIEKDAAWFRVKDTGLGISAEDLSHVFERFYRADKSRERSQGGNGLGLAIVKELVESYHGTIDITSTEGEGTTVMVQFPIANENI